MNFYGKKAECGYMCMYVTTNKSIPANTERKEKSPTLMNFGFIYTHILKTNHF